MRVFRRATSATWLARLVPPLLAGVGVPVLDAAPAAALAPAVAYRIADGSQPPTIDGRLDDDVWRGAHPASGFTQQNPDEGAPASEPTEVRILFDRDTLFIGIVCFDREPGRLVINQSRRDGGLQDDDAVTVILDTFNDRQNGFVFGTNPLGVQYDGQVAAENENANTNWDADWHVRSSVTDRGWETEMAIPLKTLRYRTGADQTWGINVMRTIRRRNEQAFLAPVPRGFTLHRVSQATRLTGLDLPWRRDVKLMPFVLGSATRDATAGETRLTRTADVGLDVKWGVRPDLTADFTVNTDFAQVEADEEQINLTRFPVFFPEKRPFFLENASMFQFGLPREIDLFFTRRVGLSASGTPVDLLAGARLSGKAAGFNVGLLSIQTRADDARGGETATPANLVSVVRLQREFGRSNAGAIFVGRLGTGDLAADGDRNRAYGVDLNLQVSTHGRWNTFIARTDSTGGIGSDYAGRSLYAFTNDTWDLWGGYTQVGTRFNPEVGFLERQGYRRPEWGAQYTWQPRRWSWIRRVWPHASWQGEYGFDGRRQSSFGHWDFAEVTLKNGAGFGWYWNTIQDRPLEPFVVHQPPSGMAVVIPPGLYAWTQYHAHASTDPSAPVYGSIRSVRGGFYDGDFESVSVEIGGRAGARLSARAGWTRQHVTLPGGRFRVDLVPIQASFAFTTLASVQALVQYNSRTSSLSSNVRLALLDRSSTGLFVVYNDRRDMSEATTLGAIGRSFVVKYTRLFDF